MMLRMFPDTITLYNRYKDASNKDQWQRTVLDRCYLVRETTKTAQVNNTASIASNVSIRIAQRQGYFPPDRWKPGKTTGPIWRIWPQLFSDWREFAEIVSNWTFFRQAVDVQTSDTFTLQAGDLVLLGNHADEITGIGDGTLASIKARLGGVEIKAVHVWDKAFMRNQHYRILGV